MLFQDARTEWENEESFSTAPIVAAVCWICHWRYHYACYCTLRTRVRSAASVIILNTSRCLAAFQRPHVFRFFFSNHVQYLFFPFNFSNRRKHLLLNGSIVDFCNSYYGNYIKELEIKIIQIALLTLITCFGSANKWGVSYYSTWMFRSSRVPRHENWMRNMSRS